MKKADLMYELSPLLIAQEPATPRDASRLLVLDRKRRQTVHSAFRNICEFLAPGCVLVLNETRVVPAKFTANRTTGSRIDGLFLRELSVGCWLVQLRGRGRLRPGETLAVGGHSVEMRLTEKGERGTWTVTVAPALPCLEILDAIGCTPLPPYIRRPPEEPARARQDDERYQTVYARQPGAVAAPTAGLHFTEPVFDALTRRGIDCVRLTLHVGLGTFSPIACDDLADHKMHAEWYDLPPPAADRINRARDAGSPVVAVGTTSARVLETCADARGRVRPGTGWTDIFIYPPYQFRCVDALVTNFHLPGSTLLAMVYAFAGADLVRRAYDEAIAAGYRFYSYGDAMLIL